MRFNLKHIGAILFALVFLVGGVAVANTARAATPGDVIINEFVSHPNTGDKEWVELLNTTGSDIDLSTAPLILRDFTALGAPNDTTLNSGVIPAMGLFVYEYSTSKLNDGGDAILLLSGTDVISGISYGSVTHITNLETVQNIAESTQGKSSAFVNGNWSTDQTPTKGWFNDTSNGAPAWNTITSSFCNPNLGPCVVGIASNITSADNPSAISGLYFEKNGLGKISLANTINMTDQAVVAKLSGLGTAMEMTDGHIKFDSATAAAMDAAGATLYMYGLPFPDGSTPNILVDGVLATDSDIGTVSYSGGTLSFTAKHFTQFDIDKNVYVNSDNICANKTPCYTTIQDAIGAASSGSTINIAAGTYIEAGQIVIDKNLSIVGTDKATTIIKPDVDYTDTWFVVNSGINFNLSKVTLDGTGKKINKAIKHQGSGVINDNIFTQIKNSSMNDGQDRLYAGTAIAIDSTQNVDITNNTFTQIGRNGILADRNTGTISGNIYTGKGDGDWMDYFVLAEYGDNITISNNTITNNTGVALTDGSDSSAIAVWNDTGTQATITGNTMTNNTSGVAVVAFPGTTTNPKVIIGSGNLFEGGKYGVDLQTYGSSFSPDITFTGASTFKGQTEQAIHLFDGVSAGQTIDISSVVFKTASDTVITDNFAIEDLVSHRIDAPNKALLVWNANNVYVTPNSFIIPTTTTPSIQRAIDAVGSSGWTVNIAPGTYTEQFTINKNLALKGAGDTTVIQSPNTLTSTFTTTINGNVSPMKPIITVDGANADISYLKVDGNGKGDSITNTFFVGIGFYNAGGSVDHATLIGVKETPASRDYQGDAIRATNANGSSRTLNITNSTVSDFQKNGIILSGSGLAVTVSNNHVTGNGSNLLVAQNGIVLGSGVTGSVTGNTVSNIMCDDSTCGNNWYTDYQALAISINGAIGPMIVSNNVISNSDIGIYSDISSGTATITDNTLTNNRYFGMLFGRGTNTVSDGSITGGEIGIFNPSDYSNNNLTVHNVAISNNSIKNFKNDVNLSVDAINNYWGSAVSADVIAKISGNVSYSPWYVDSGFLQTNIDADLASAKASAPSSQGTYTDTSWGTLTTALALPETNNEEKITKTNSINSAVGGLVFKTDQTISFDTTLGDKIYGDADFGVSATATSTLPVSFTSTTTDVCTISSGTIHIANVGTCTIRATQDGDGNYNAAAPVDQSFTVTAKQLTVSTPSAISLIKEVYDGSTATTVTAGALSGVVSGDTVGVTAVANYDTKNVGSSKVITVVYTLSGTDAAKYIKPVDYSTNLGQINPKHITGNFTANNKVYDGNNSAETLSLTLNNKVGDDIVNLIGGTATFSDANAADGKTVTLVGATIAGADYGNYVLDSVGTTTANITKRPITITAVTNTKTVDGNTSASGVPTLAGTLPTDTYITLTETYDTPTAGTGKTLTPNALITYGGTDATSNYNITKVTNTSGVILANDQSIPNTNGDATLNSTKPEVVITNPTQPVTIAVETSNATLDLTGLINTNTGTGTLPEMTITANNANVEIPASTVVTASGWDGVMYAPTAGTKAGTAPAGFSVGNNVVEMGSPDVTLTFDKAVKITLAGVTGNVGYRPAGSSTWTQITKECTSATVPGISSGECYFHEGSNTIIWTYHFTTFGELNVVHSSSGSYVKPVVTPAIPAKVEVPEGCTPGAKFSTTTGKNCNASISAGEGKVLGTEKFNFTILIKKGSKGNEVIELQKLLTSLGYDVGIADGKFGPKTKAAVIKFQIANKLVGDGVVGTKTRAMLNK